MSLSRGAQIGALGVLLVAALAGCGKSQPGSSSARDYVRVAIANEIPYGYMDEKGQARGIAPDIARRTLQDMGYKKIDWAVLPFGSLIPALNAGRVDLVAAGQAILPSRCKVVRFSQPNSSYGEGMLVRAGNPQHIHGYAAFLHNRHLRLGIVSGADELDIAQALHIPSSQLVMLDNNSDAVGALLGRRIDAYAATRLSVVRLAHKAKKVQVATPFQEPVIHGQPVRSYGGFAFRLDDTHFADAFDKALAKVQASPFYAKTLHHYGLNSADIAAVHTMSTAALCAGK